MSAKRSFANTAIDTLPNLDMSELEFWKKKSIDSFPLKHKVLKRCLCPECHNVPGISELWDADLKVPILNHWRPIFFDEHGSKMQILH